MMKKFCILFGLLVIILIFTNCKKELNNPPDPGPSGDTTLHMTDLVIPSEFNFETSVNTQVSISDFKSTRADDVKYEVYLYNSQGVDIQTNSAGDDGDALAQSGTVVDVLNNLNAIKITGDPSFSLDITKAFRRLVED